MKKKIAILGSTGSIGKTLIEIIKKNWGHAPPRKINNEINKANGNGKKNLHLLIY